MDNSIPPIAMGSHLDTVATGGRFDGPLGVSGTDFSFPFLLSLPSVVVLYDSVNEFIHLSQYMISRSFAR